MAFVHVGERVGTSVLISAFYEFIYTFFREDSSSSELSLLPSSDEEMEGGYMPKRIQQPLTKYFKRD